MAKPKNFPSTADTAEMLMIFQATPHRLEKLLPRNPSEHLRASQGVTTFLFGSYGEGAKLECDLFERLREAANLALSKPLVQPATPDVELMQESKGVWKDTSETCKMVFNINCCRFGILDA